MADRFLEYRNRRNESAWLGALVETMKRVSRPDVAKLRCDRNVIDALKAKLERPPLLSRPPDFATRP